MEKYNVTKTAPRALRNKAALAVAALSSAILQTRVKVRSISDRKNAFLAVLWELRGCYRLIHAANDARASIASHLNTTLVYQGRIVAKFATIGGASAVVPRD